MDMHVAVWVVLWIIAVGGALFTLALSYSASNDIRMRRAGKPEPLPSRAKVACQIIMANVCFLAAVGAVLILVQ